MRIKRYLKVFAVMFFALSVLLSAALAAERKERSFLFTYKAKLKDLPPGELKFWIPAAVSGGEQRVELVKALTPVPAEMRKEGQYGNSYLFGTLKGDAKEAEIELQFKVTRYEQRVDLAGTGGAKAASQKELARALAPDRLVPLDERIRKLAAEVTKGKAAPLEKARAIYDYVVETMTYDKSGTGWGRGDIYYACDIRRGNCTDFHALFIGLCRASGIPARFIIGFPLPEGKREGTIGGYHCWAEFYVEGHGWIPVDTSEASKNKAKKGYFFGTICENRVAFTQGRDILLDPPQKGERLNYFIYPYFELEGKPYNSAEKSFSFREIQ